MISGVIVHLWFGFGALLNFKLPFRQATKEMLFSPPHQKIKDFIFPKF
jgi:hypothetical protein